MQDRDQQCVLLVGNPNVGKTLLFNRLTGLSAKVANYPGITVEFKKGKMKYDQSNSIEVVDLPGTYGLDSRSEDEEITYRGLKGEIGEIGAPSLVVAVVNASQLKRNLYLVSQLLEQKMPLVIVLTMMDLAEKKGIKINVSELASELGVHVIATSSLTDRGSDELKEFIAKYCHSDKRALPRLKLGSSSPESISAHYRRIDGWIAKAVHVDHRPFKSDFHIDQILLHRVWGPFFLLIIFAFMFEVLFSGSKPIVDWIDDKVHMISEWVRYFFDAGSLTGSLLADGIIAGVGSVLSFVPLIAFLFLFIGLLEDSGYLARATFLLDRLMSKVGLPGRAFVPLLSGFACAVPAILATRVIESRKDRLITILVTPLMSCSARLPIYGLLISTCFASMPPLWGFVEVGAVVMVGMYALGILAAFCAAALFKRFAFKGPTPALILELPPYRMPRLKSLCQNVAMRVRVFLREAGTVIMAMTVVLWALFAFPRTEQPESAGSTRLEQSYAGQIGHLIEPVIAPLGFDWKMGVGLLASFAAREVMVSTLGVVYGLGDRENHTSTSLRQAIQNDRNPITGKPLYTPLVALSLMVFFSLSMQCMSTLATTKKETKSWRWPIVQLSYMTMLAWVSSFSLFQVGSALGF